MEKILSKVKNLQHFYLKRSFENQLARYVKIYNDFLEVCDAQKTIICTAWMGPKLCSQPCWVDFSPAVKGDLGSIS